MFFSLLLSRGQSILSVFFVYILYSEKFDMHYVGQTVNVAKRLFRHNNGLELFTKKYAPWTLIFTIEQNTRSEAIRLEKKLKNLSRDRLVSFIRKYHTP